MRRASRQRERTIPVVGAMLKCLGHATLPRTIVRSTVPIALDRFGPPPVPAMYSYLLSKVQLPWLPVQTNKQAELIS